MCCVKKSFSFWFDENENKKLVRFVDENNLVKWYIKSCCELEKNVVKIAKDLHGFVVSL